jgi:hypothetical protein
VDPVITLDTICRPSPDVVARDIEGDLVIVPLVSGIGDADDELYTLNDTGRAIWDGLDGRRTLAEVAARLAEQFEAAGDELESDVVGFAQEMVRRGILSVGS